MKLIEANVNELLCWKQGLLTETLGLPLVGECRQVWMSLYNDQVQNTRIFGKRYSIVPTVVVLQQSGGMEDPACHWAQLQALVHYSDEVYLVLCGGKCLQRKAQWLNQLQFVTKGNPPVSRLLFLNLMIILASSNSWLRQLARLTAQIVRRGS